MRRGLRLGALLLVVALGLAGCGLGAPADTRLTAEFANTNNLFEGSEVRVLGLPVGEVAAIRPRGEHVEVDLVVDADQPIPAGVSAELVPSSLLGERFVQLGPPYTDGPTIEDGATIPLARTTQPAEIDEVLASFERFLASLDRDALADLVDAMAGTVSGQGEGLNELIDDGTEAVRVLADADDDLGALVAEFADLNETLATRDERIGSTLQEFSTTLRVLIDEREEILGAVAELHRLTAELQPLLDDHADPLVDDLEAVTTSLATVDRNLDRLGDVLLGGRQLFAGSDRAIDFDRGWLHLHEEAEELSGLLVERLVQRFVGLCLRLEVTECADAEFFADAVHGFADDRDQLVGDLGGLVAELVAELPDEAREGLDEVPGVPTDPPQGGDQPDAPGEPGPQPEPEPTDEPDGLLDELLGGAP